MRCEHGQCTCLTDEGRFCSDHCRQMVEMPDTIPGEGIGARSDCGCGHIDCAGGLTPLT